MGLQKKPFANVLKSNYSGKDKKNHKKTPKLESNLQVFGTSVQLGALHNLSEQVLQSASSGNYFLSYVFPK